MTTGPSQIGSPRPLSQVPRDRMRLVVVQLLSDNISFSGCSGIRGAAEEDFFMHNKYCMFKGVLVNAAPFKPEYPGSPHYVVTVKDGGGKEFKIVINSASDTVG